MSVDLDYILKNKDKIDWDNKEQVLEIVKEFSSFLKEASSRLQDDLDVVLAAVQNSGFSIEHASNRLQNHPKVLETTIESLEREWDANAGWNNEIVPYDFDVANTQSTIREKIEILENRLNELKTHQHTPEEIVEGINPTQGEIQRVGAETVERATPENEKQQEEDGQTQAD